MSSTIRQNEVLFHTENYIRQHFSHEGSGHDWWHIYRVRKMSLKLAKVEGGDVFIIEMAALLHDLDDWKLVKANKSSATQAWLSKMNVPDNTSKKIRKIIEQVSFKGAGVENKATSLEAQIVQDADRLDAMGAIGIARTFAYGGNKGRLIHNPEIKAVMHNNFEDYKKSTGPTINHFYEKLLLLKDLINTKTAKEIANARHCFMESFLEQFFSEWECKI